MQTRLTQGTKHSDLDRSYSKSKDVELATSFHSSYSSNNNTEEKDYKPPQNILTDDLNKSRFSIDTSANSSASQRFQLAKQLSFKDKIEIQKIKFMKFKTFVDSLEIELDMNTQFQKNVDVTSKKTDSRAQEHSWVIRRRYQELINFDQKNEQARMKIITSRTNYKQFNFYLIKKVKKELKGQKCKSEMPDLPFGKEPKNHDPNNILNFLETYLKSIIQLDYVCKTAAFWEFIELSDYNHEGNIKVKESFIKKRAGGHFQKRNCFASCINPFNVWQRRYVVITSEGIMYSISNRAPKTVIREMMLFDHNFDMKYGKLWTQRHFGIIMMTTTRRLQLEAYDLFHFVDIIASIKDAMKLSPYVELHRYDSFAPIRQKAFCQWYVDGEGYFSSLYEKLNNANHEVFITDWWLSPQMYLQRPVNEYTNQETRLDRVLERLANKGVKVYIIVYREPTIALNLNSNFTKLSLQSLHQNIRVLRHPSTLIPLLWSHHEKMVVVDQVYGFLGGLDICYGRWDSQSHPLIDQNVAKQYFPGIDYSNSRIRDFQNVKEFTKSEISRDTQPRMPWHDIAMMVMGEPVKDMVRHFIQYWNFAKLDIYSKNSKQQIDHLIPGVDDKKNKNKDQGPKSYWNRFLSKFKSKDENDAYDFRKQAQKSINNNQDIISKKRSQTIQVNKNKGNRFNAYLDKVKVEIEEHHHNHLPAIQEEKANKNSLDKINNKKLKKGSLNEDFQQREELASPKKKGSADEKNVTQDITLKNILADVTMSKTKSEDGNERDSDQKGQIRPKGESKTEMSQVNQFNDSNQNSVNTSQILNSFNNDLSGIKSEQKTPEQFLNSIRFRKSDIQQVRNTRASSVAVNPSIQNRESYKPFSLEYEDMHELNKYDLYVPIIEKLKKNYEESGEQDQNYYIIFNQSQQIQDNRCSSNISDYRNTSQNITPFNIYRNHNQNKVTPINDSQEGRKRDMSDCSDYTGNDSMKEDDDSFDTSGVFKRNFDNLKLENNSFQQNGSCVCQMLRSSCSWSLGLEKKNHEMSIQLAYIDLITSSTSFIYIENQFFISCSAGSKVKNQIAQALIERIKKAADNDEVFKVVVVMPLLPGFEGEVHDSGSGVMKCQLHWEYSTISRGGTSILEELRSHPKIDDPSKYIQFYGLRQHAIVDNKPTTEIIYVHSKLMIVDDNYAIMGSANINDRSMLGTRDSEIAMVVEDTEKVLTSWNEKVKKVGKFSHTLRTALYQEHFGLTESEAKDPLCEQTNELITSRAKQNTLIYRKAFACYPDDKVEVISQLEEFQKSKKPEIYLQFKDNIIGNAVELPLDFLKRENLNFSYSQKEYYVPDENFT